MKSLEQTNSWHWLTISLVVSVLLGGYLFQTVWSKTAAKNAPRLQQMRTHGEELVLLNEADAILLEQQVDKLEKQITAYEAAVAENGEQPVPEGENSVLMLSNEINTTLQAHHLRVVEREQISERPGANPAPGPRPQARAARGDAEAEKKPEVKLPYQTREIHYVLEGAYKDMFMFLVKQSHLKPPYHFKNIQITPFPDREGMRMTFTVQIHFT